MPSPRKEAFGPVYQAKKLINQRRNGPIPGSGCVKRRRIVHFAPATNATTAALSGGPCRWRHWHDVVIGLVATTAERFAESLSCTNALAQCLAANGSMCVCILGKKNGKPAPDSMRFPILQLPDPLCVNSNHAPIVCHARNAGTQPVGKSSGRNSFVRYVVAGSGLRVEYGAWSVSFGMVFWVRALHNTR